MKIGKRVVAGIVLIALVMALEAACNFSDTDFTYLEESGQITITGYTGAGGTVTIPDTIDGKSVTSIGDDSFWGCSTLTSITIPDGVTSIGTSAFSGTSLTSISIPDSVTSIGNLTFSKCSALTSISIPDGVTVIDAGAFEGCKNLVIHCPEASKAYQYAIDNGIEVVIEG